MEFYKKSVFKNVTAYILQLEKFSDNIIEPEDDVSENDDDNDDNDSINVDKEHVDRLFLNLKNHIKDW
jgi:hypothetical protein